MGIPFDILDLQEACADASSLDSELYLSSYNLVRKDINTSGSVVACMLNRK